MGSPEYVKVRMNIVVKKELNSGAIVLILLLVGLIFPFPTCPQA